MYELAGFGSLKGVKKAICGITCIAVTKEAVNLIDSFIHVIKKLSLRKITKNSYFTLKEF